MNALARFAAAWLLPAAAFIAGCATTPSPSSAPPPLVVPAPPPGATPPAPPPSPLEGEVRWMRQLFDGTPVVVDTERDGAMRVEVPLQYAFDGDQAAIKPPLNAVLEKVALSMKRNPTARVHLASPGKAAAAARTAAMRTHLRNHGVAPARISTGAAQREDVVVARMVPGAVGIDKLDDSKLPPPPPPPSSQH